METNTIQETTNIFPVIPLRARVAYPNVHLAFEVVREVTLRALDYAARVTDQTVVIFTQKQTEKQDLAADDLYKVGCVAKIQQISQVSEGVVRVTCECLYRVRARSIRKEDGLFSAVCDPLPTEHGEAALEEAYLRAMKSLVNTASRDGNIKLPKEAIARLNECEDAERYLHVAMSALLFPALERKQAVLEENNLPKRLKLFEDCLRDELETAKIERKIAASVRKSIEKNQKEYYLREQLKAIREELGEGNKESDEYRARILDKHLPEKLEIKCLKETDKLERTPSNAAEYQVIANYLDQVLALPFSEETKDTESLSACADVLNADHFGLEKIKERILEYLAVLKLTGTMRAPILCFVGPPGVGKTSIAQSVARALGRKFVRMSLGGVKDEAEIRGHRRTYIGAMPGRILYAMKNAETVNPVFLLDEIDKLSSDAYGDPSSALLEVLDPEQNATFRDRYLEYPYDLSKVLFIATANTLESIPSPLRDRMEIIELSGYTLEEKTEIARRYLVPKQREANGLKEDDLSLSDDGIRACIEGYTREAGVRSLERTVGTVCRKIAVQRANGHTVSALNLDKTKIEDLLGAPKFTKEANDSSSEVGVATGLAWTAVGGTTLAVECMAMPGKGDVKLTGQLGDVMKESAQAALSYLRANARKYELDAETFSRTDLHIHVPEGATPKDGPSAGITIATAILSALTGRAVRGDIAMTGEITLRGKVLPIGGLKEKSLAARRIGIQTVLIPEGNAREIPELPETVRQSVRFLPVRHVDEVFAAALEERTSVAQAEKPKKKRTPKPLPSAQSSGREEGVRCRS